MPNEYNNYLLRLAMEEDIEAMSPADFVQAEAEYGAIIDRLDAGTDAARDRVRYYELEMLLAI